jgi:hypothetical protein
MAGRKKLPLAAKGNNQLDLKEAEKRYGKPSWFFVFAMTFVIP